MFKQVLVSPSRGHWSATGEPPSSQGLFNETVGENPFDSMYMYLDYIVNVHGMLCLQSIAVVIWICFSRFKQKPFKALIFNKHLNQLLWVDPRTIMCGNLLNAYFIWLSTFSFKHQAGTRPYNSFDVGFAKPALEKNKIHGVVSSLPPLFFVSSFAEFQTWLRDSAQHVSAATWFHSSNHFHTARNIRRLLFAKQQMRLMLSSGEKFNIIC